MLYVEMSTHASLCKGSFVPEVKREKVVGLPRLFSPGTQALSVTVIVASVAGSAVAHAPSENSAKVTFSCGAGPSVALTEPTLDAMKPGTAAGTSAEHVP